MLHILHSSDIGYRLLLFQIIKTSQGIVLWIHPGRLPGFGPERRAELLDRRQDWNRSKERNDSLRRKRPGPAGSRLPRCNEELSREMSVGSGRWLESRRTHRVDESAEVEEDGVEGDNAHGLKRVTVDDIARDHRIAHLDPGSNCTKLSLAFMGAL